MIKVILKSSLLALTIAAGLTGCSDDKTAGTVTDTGNTVASSEVKVAGVVHRVDGSAADDAIVRMARMRIVDGVGVPEHLEVSTDTAGAFAFDSVLADTFQLAVIDASVSEIFYLPKTTRESKDFDSIQLSKAAVFSSTLYYEDVVEPAVPVGSHFMVYVEGTPFYQSVFAGDSFSILIPEGSWWMEFFPGDPQIVAKLQDSGVADSLIFRTWSMTSKVEAGDTVNVGPFVWSTTSEVDSLMVEEEREAEIVSRISGKVLCKNETPCKGVEVSLVTDLYGFDFEGDSLEFVAATTTDSLGRWWLPVPAEVPDDSFRVEYRLMDGSSVLQAGVSRYVLGKEVKNLLDTLSIGKTVLAQPSGLVSGVQLVIDREDPTQSNNCMVNSVVVGIKGTTHFVREVTCDKLMIDGLPAGDQDLLLYTGDPKVIDILQKNETDLDSFVTQIHVNLPENRRQEVQWMTYTPPTKPQTSK